MKMERGITEMQLSIMNNGFGAVCYLTYKGAEFELVADTTREAVRLAIALFRRLHEPIVLTRPVGVYG